MTIDHRYTIEQIDRMRVLVGRTLDRCRWVTQSYGEGSSERIGELENKVEQRLRTYMMAGTRPEELEARVAQLEEESERQRLACPTDEEYAAQSRRGFR